MQNPQNKGSSTGQKPPSSQPFLQDSSLITDLPGQLSGVEAQLRDPSSSGSVPKTEPVPSGNSGGQVTLDFTIRFSDLRFGDLLGQGGSRQSVCGGMEI